MLVNGKTVQLTFTEFGILHYLAAKPGWVFTRNQIVDTVRGEDYFVTDRSVDVQLSDKLFPIQGCSSDRGKSMLYVHHLLIREE